MKILCVSPLLPVPAVSGSRIRIVKLLQALSGSDEVDLLSMKTPGVGEEELAVLRQSCRHVDLAEPVSRAEGEGRLAALGMAARGVPLAVRDVDSPGLRRTLARITGERDYDIIQIEHSHSAHLLDSISPRSRAGTVLATHNVVWLQYKRVWEFEPRLRGKCRLLLTWLPMRRWEPKMAARFDKVLTVSDVDKQCLLELRRDLDIETVPNGVCTREIQPYPRAGRKPSVLFVGSMDYAPNADGILHFHRDVLPLLRQRMPDCGLTIVGKSPPRSILDLASAPGVRVFPDVKDVRPFYGEGMAAGVYLRSGGGTRLKILEAMAAGTPVVSTAVGCEGIAVRDRENILVADRPQDFADRLYEVMTDAGLWSRISTQGRRLVEERYDWGVVARGLRDIFGRVLARRRTGRG